MIPTTVHQLIERQAFDRPNSIYALATEGDCAVSYRELASGCRRIAGLLQSRGLSPGETVSVVMPNGMATLRLLLGVLWSGRCVNPVNLLAQPEQMRYVIEHSDCRLVVVAPEWEAKVRGLIVGIERPIELLVADPNALELPGERDFSDDSFEEQIAPPSGALALLMYTSGTTGVPKGVMLTQGNLAANALAIAAEHALGAGDRVLAVLPLYHINAFAVAMLAPLASGGSLAMAPKFSAGRFWEQTLGCRCNWLNIVPTIVSYLLNAPAPPRAALSHIRFCRSASAALPPEYLRSFEETFGIGMIETMGLTETVAPAFSNPLDPTQRKLGSVGLPSGCEARIVAPDLHAVADGVTGEIVIRGPNVMSGYYKNPEATAATFTPDGWLRTGDLGHRDADGFYFVTGRIKELIIKGGENIAPREIDEILLRHPAVLDAAAVGIPDPHYGQDIMACIVLRQNMSCSEDNLREFCVQHLGRYKTPRLFRFVDDLPRGPSGKVQRLKLLELCG